MAECALFHKKKLDDFIQWLITDGWTVEPAKGGYEILRARKSGRKYPFIAYDRNNAAEHYVIADRDAGVIQAYLKAKKQKNLCAGIPDAKPPLREVYVKNGIVCVDGVPAEFYEFNEFWETHGDDKDFVLLYLDADNKIVQ